jgi:hypothetical protein
MSLKVSEVTVTNVAEYLRLEDGEYTESELDNLLNVARKFIKSYTGLSEDEIDTHEDFYIVVMVLCQDMYDNRSYYVDKNNLNKVVETILGMHSVNLL